MFRPQRARRCLSALTVAAYLATSLLAPGAHDSGTSAAGHPAAAALGSRTADRPTTAAKPPACRHAGCRHAHRLGPARSAAVADSAAGWHAASTETPSFATACLACDFLAGSISILPAMPTVRGPTARWHDAPPVRPLHRAAVITAFLARGPPA